MLAGQEATLRICAQSDVSAPCLFRGEIVTNCRVPLVASSLDSLPGEQATRTPVALSWRLRVVSTYQSTFRPAHDRSDNYVEVSEMAFADDNMVELTLAPGQYFQT